MSGPPPTVQFAPGSPPGAGGWLRRLSSGQRIGVLIGGGVALMLLLCCGGLAAIATLAGNPTPTGSAGQQAGGQQSQPADALRQAGDSPTVSATTAPPPPAQPVVEVKTVTETQAIAFPEKTVNDASLAKGTRKVKTPGVAGSKQVTYQVTYTDGVETSRQQVKEVITKKPVTQITAVGTKVAAKPTCDPNYSGACVPIASDVDCAGGSGNGPAYVQGPVKVIGDDIYDLDRDGDGWACE